MSRRWPTPQVDPSASQLHHDRGHDRAIMLEQDQNEINGRIDRIVGDPDAPTLTARFFEPEGPFAGETFDLLDLETSDANVFNVADLLAVTFLDVTVRPPAVRRTLGTDQSRLSLLLSAVRDDVDLWNATDDDLARAEMVWRTLRGYDGIGQTTAGKLLARKRPRLIPVVDSVVKDALAAPPGTYWVSLRAALSDPDRRTRIEELRPEGLDRRISTLRLLDAAIWMTESRGRNARAVRSERTPQ